MRRLTWLVCRVPGQPDGVESLGQRTGDRIECAVPMPLLEAPVDGRLRIGHRTVPDFGDPQSGAPGHLQQPCHLRRRPEVRATPQAVSLRDRFVLCSDLLKKKRFVALVFRQDRWTSEFVASACRIARMWGRREPIVN